MILSFTGHRTERLGDDAAGAWIAVHDHISSARPDEVVSGMADGVDTFAFDIALELGIPVCAAVPWIGFSPKGDRDAYMRRLERASRVVVTSPTEEFHKGVYLIRDRWMVDHGDRLAAVWDSVRGGGTWNTMEYARKVGRETVQLKWRSR